MEKKILFLCFLIVFLNNTSFIQIIVNPTYLGWISNSIYIVSVFLLFPKIHKKGDQLENIYIGVMLLGLIFHLLLPNQKQYPIIDTFKWIILIFLIIASREYNSPPLLFFILIAFYISNCIIAMLESKLQTNFIDYFYVESLNSLSLLKSNEFRAFGLIDHPLASANITLIIMAFIMVSKDINLRLKIILLTLGPIALLSFNSRTAIIIGICLMVYYYLLYNVKPFIIILIAIIFYTLFLSDLQLIIQQNASIFGRLSEKNNLIDESSLTRISSYLFFWNARWNFQDIVLGGRIIYLPGFDLSLENGALLTIAWWGWFVGPLKVILELVISYSSLNTYAFKEKIIIMIASWGTAFSNNNTVNTFVFAFFIISNVSINSLSQNKKVIVFKHLKNKK